MLLQRTTWLFFVVFAGLTVASRPAQAQYDCASQSQLPQVECQALVALYNSTDGDNWTTNTGWLETTTPCSWQGVVCGGGYVTTLQLSNNNLSGPLPSQLGDLSGLGNAYLESNQLSGSIPAELGNLASLSRLWLYNNQLSGSIPAELGNLDNLSQLTLSSNQLSGPVPTELSNLTQLTRLWLGTNQLTDPLPLPVAQLGSGIGQCVFTPNATLCVPDTPEYQAIGVDPICGLPLDAACGAPPPNVPPTVSITAPAEGANFEVGTDVVIDATSSDSDGTVTQVAFFDGATLLSTDTSAPYSHTITGATAGSYVLTAQATDDEGATTTSSVVNFSVGNAPPTVSITAPANGASFNEGDDVVIDATSSDSDGTVTQVAFFDGATLLSTDTSAPYSHTITGATAGSYVLTAQATDDEGATTTSSVVDVAVLGPPPPGYDCTTQSEIPLLECQALVVLYNSTNGDNWTVRTDWLLTTTPCSWYGIKCKSGHISEINIEGNNLNGPIPPELANLTTMQALRMGRNNAGSNFLTGSLPPELGSITTLVHIFVGYNNLTGPIPAELGNLTNLRGLHIGGNQMSGPLPPELGNLTEMNSLTMYGQNLSGPIPPEWGNMTKMERFWAYGNQLTGPLPPELGNITALQELELQQNQLSGPLPLELGNLTEVTRLRLDDNQFTGAVPLAVAEMGATVANCSFSMNDTLCVPDTSPYQAIGVDPICELALSTSCGAPTVSITAPSDGALFNEGDDVVIQATASDGDGTVTQVEFFNGATLLSTDTSAPYSHTITGATAGSYTLTARATDDVANATTSDPIGVTVNAAPTVAITAPADGALFNEGDDIVITASASDADGTVTQVEFFNGATLLSTDTSAPYSHTITGATAGSYTLTAQATDNDLNTTISDAVGVTVNAAPTVAITAPADGALFNDGDDVVIQASASDADGTVTQVEFFADATSLGVDTAAPFEITWMDVVAGNYTLTARATDDGGATTTSEIVNISVLAFDCTTQTEIPLAECQTLVVLYNATDGDNWSNRTDWLATTTPCSWYGITCQSSQVREINLGANNLTGSIPTELGNLTQLSRLLLNGNSLSGSIPAELGNLTNLTRLWMEANQLTGVIPAELGNLTNLNQLSINNNQLSGSVPSELGALTQLTRLWLNNNQLTDAVPLSVAQLGSSVSNCDLTSNDTLCVPDTSPYQAIGVDPICGLALSTSCGAPTVSITAPADGALFNEGDDVVIQASASDADGTVTQVEFFADATSLGVDTAAPFEVTWMDVVAGSYTLTAQATDNDLNTTISDAVGVTVAAFDPAPTVSITAPTDGVLFNDGDDVVIQASASDADGTVTQVEFFNGATLLSTDTSAPYSHTITGAAAGSYTLTAQATDNDLNTTISDAVGVTVLDPPPPGYDCTTQTQLSLAECQTLVVLYNATDGDNWSNRTDWLATTMPCSWYGITCQSNQVKEINLGANNLSGTIPSQLGILSLLNRLLLNGNSLSGSIPAELGNLTNLTRLWMEANQLTGVIPAELGNLTNLNQLSINNNQLSGSVPSELGALTQLTRLWLNNNQLTDAVPLSVAQLGSSVSNCDLTSNDTLCVPDTSPYQAIGVDPICGLALSTSCGAPTVSITAPSDGALFNEGDDVVIQASASDADGTVTQVEFFNGATLLSTDTSAPYSHTITGATAGSYTLTAQATDNDLNTTISDAVGVTVAAFDPAPTVSITAPTDGALFNDGDDVVIQASASDADGTVTQVEFFNGATLLSTDTSAPYSHTITGAAAGSYTLTAQATDNDLNTTISDAVGVTVLDPPPPGYDCTTQTQLSLAECQTLVVLYNATDGDNWSNRTDWLATTMPCSWYGVECQSGKVKNLNLGANNLSGTIPSQLGILSLLNRLLLNGNSLSGSIPAELGNLTNLTRLWMEANQLTGVIPAELGNLTKLTHLTLHSNQLSGSVPAELSSLTSLTRFWLGGNGLTGAVPLSVAQLGSGIGQCDFSPNATLCIPNTTEYQAIGVDPICGLALSTSCGAPTVSITAPSDGALFNEGDDVVIQASASDADGTVTQVEFFNGATLLSTDTSAPYSHTITGATAGSYTLTAQATDNDLNTTISDAVGVTVAAFDPAPTVSITAPTDGALFNDGDDVVIQASASDADGTVTQVEFFNGATLLSTDTSAPYSHTITGAAAGSYTLTAQATDNDLNTTISDAVGVTVLDPPPPGYDCTTQTQLSLAECQTLVVLYNATDGDNWSNRTDWLATTMPCSWYGVECQSGKVKNLNLGANNLSGTIPSQLGILSLLNRLLLNGNSLSGSIPAELGNLTNLTRLWMEANQLTGVIPAELGNLTKLTHLTLHSNQLSGSVPAELSSLTSLTRFWLGGNGLTGAVPLSVAQLGSGIGQCDFSPNATLCIPNTTEYQAIGVDPICGLALSTSCGAPTVSITAPSDGALFNEGDDVVIQASASDADGTVTQVEFFNGATLLSTDTSAPYSHTITGATAGSYTLTAQATDNDLNTTISDAVGVTVAAFDPAPTVSITAPTDGALFNDGDDVVIQASASDADGTVTQVEFFNGATLLSTDTSAPYSHTITGAAAGSYTLTAQATDNDLNTTISDAVGVTVLDPPPPGYDCTTQTQLSLAECQTLVVLYNATDGDNWSNRTDWLATTMPCSWYGVECQSGKVKNLNLGANNLSGTIPSQLGILSLLNRLLLNGNSLSGSIPAELGNLTNLTRLWMEANQLTGVIPAELGNLTKLTHLTLHSNQLSGSVPAELSSLTSLTRFWLGGNGLTGAVPLSVAQLGSGIGQCDFSPNATLCIPNTTEYQAIGVDPICGLALSTSCGAPTVSITAPSDGALFNEGDDVVIQASASDADGTVTQVEFFNGATLLSTDTSAPYSHTITGATAGSYTLTAQATDNDLNTTISDAVGVTVAAFDPAPTVSITAPTDGALFNDGDDVVIQASASDADGTVTQVEFFNGATLLSTDTSAPYSHTITGAAAGSYTLTAQATDNDLNTTISDAVGVTVLDPPPPGYDCTTQTQLSLAECQTLVVLYNATDGDNWSNRTDWLATTMPCSWYGVECQSGKVKNLNLGANNLSGTIPSQLGILSLLNRLLLNGNSLSGSIPAELGNLTNLTRLWMEANQLTGVIPAELGNLTKLTHLTLHSNQLSGSVPAELSSLTSLTRFWLGGNGLTGAVPLSVAQLGSGIGQCDFSPNATLCIPNTTEYQAIGANPICDLPLDNSCGTASKTTTAVQALAQGNDALLSWQASPDTATGLELEHEKDQTWHVLSSVEADGSYHVSDLTPGLHRFRLKETSAAGAVSYSATVELVIGLPEGFYLTSAYPNPFNPQTSFTLTVAESQQVEVSVYDVLGRRVALLHEGLFAGNTARVFRFKGGRLPSGMYVIVVAGEHFRAIQQIMLVK